MRKAAKVNTTLAIKARSYFVTLIVAILLSAEQEITKASTRCLKATERGAKPNPVTGKSCISYEVTFPKLSLLKIATLPADEPTARYLPHGLIFKRIEGTVAAITVFSNSKEYR